MQLKRLLYDFRSTEGYSTHGKFFENKHAHKPVTIAFYALHDNFLLP